MQGRPGGCSLGATAAAGARLVRLAGRRGRTELAHHRAQARGVDGLLEEERGMESGRLRLEVSAELGHEQDERGDGIEDAKEPRELPGVPHGASCGGEIEV